MMHNNSRRYLSTILKKCTARLLSHRSYEEVKVPVPWGYLAGKWWTPHDKRPILTFHGWQENADSFNRLIPYLPDDLGVLALEFPGHGLSSHLPKGFSYHNVDSIVLYKRIMKYFNWNKVSLMGHSLGATTNLMYAIMYPEQVDILICIDGFYFYSKSFSEPQRMAKIIDTFLKHDEIECGNKEPPCYTLKDLAQRLHLGSGRSLNLEFAADMLQRSVAPSKSKPGMFYGTRDIRLKSPSLLQWHPEIILKGAERIKCPIFLSIGTQSVFYASQANKFKEMIKVYQKHNEHCYFYEFNDETHHLHINKPELLSGPLNEFLSKYYVQTH